MRGTVTLCAVSRLGAEHVLNGLACRSVEGKLRPEDPVDNGLLVALLVLAFKKEEGTGKEGC